ncbi:MAG: hypothetical protein KatS3mg105_1895 [Gemmatales bacterium]|nr:MAG: hypothetical protein KatS3mg105_1895 [Gemmatales bacterium]
MSQQNESGRNENGQFAKGNRFGKGNPFARQVAQLRKALVDAFSEEDIAEIAQKLKQMCLEGNLAAIKIVFSYLLGKPDAPVDPDTLDLQEWQIREQEPTMAELHALSQSYLPAGFANIIAHGRAMVNMKQIMSNVYEINQEKERQRAKREARRKKEEERRSERRGVSATCNERRGVSATSASEPSPNGDFGERRSVSATCNERQSVSATCEPSTNGEFRDRWRDKTDS